jgi:hypothetical protein
MSTAPPLSPRTSPRKYSTPAETPRAQLPAVAEDAGDVRAGPVVEPDQLAEQRRLLSARGPKTGPRPRASLAWLLRVSLSWISKRSTTGREAGRTAG